MNFIFFPNTFACIFCFSQPFIAYIYQSVQLKKMNDDTKTNDINGSSTYWVTKLKLDLLEAVQTKFQSQAIDYQSLLE